MTAAPSTAEATETTEAAPSIQLPINTDTDSILLNVEKEVKTLLKSLARKEDVDGADIKIEAYSHLPNSITGVVMHYVVKGLKDEFDIGFKEQPKSLKIRGNSAMDKKVAGKKRLLTREQKNELLSKTQMSYYETKVSSKEITIMDAMNSIKEAYEKKMEFEAMGYMLPEKKTAYPFWVDEAGEEG